MEEEIDVQGGLVDRSIAARPVEARRRRELLAEQRETRQPVETGISTVPTPTLNVQQPLSLSDNVGQRQQFEQAQAAIRERDYAQSGVGQVDDMNINPETGKPYTALERAQQQERSARFLLQDKRQELARGAEERNQQIVDQVEAEFKPIIEEGVRANQQTETEGSIQDALTGAARGTRAQLRAQRRDDAAKQLERRIQAQKRAQLDLRLAQAAGEDEAIIESLRNRALNATAAVDNAYGEIELIDKEQSEFDRQLQLSELSQEQSLERIRLQDELRRAPTVESKRESFFQQIERGGEDFLSFIQSQPQEQLQDFEKELGFIPGFLKAASTQSLLNNDPNNSFTFSPPKIDNFGQVVTPGYIFNKDKGVLEVINPSTGSTTPVAYGPNAANAIPIFRSFDEYISTVGNGNVVEGSPYHSGFEVDIDGAIGDVIPSFISGVVKKVIDSNEGYGKHVIVEDGNGREVLYAHLNDFLVNEGDFVQSGMPLGTMGNTGSTIPGSARSDGSHLHIETRDQKTGEKIPLSAFSARDVNFTPQSNTQSLLVEARLKGWESQDDQKFYIDSKRAGQTLPEKSVFENSRSLTTAEKAKLNKEMESSDAYKAIVNSRNSLDALSAFEDAWKSADNNFLGLNFAGSDAAELSTKYNAAMVTLKEFFNLGVLNGPDLELLQSIIPDPTSAWKATIGGGAFKGGGAAVDSGIQAMKEMLAKKIKADAQSFENSFGYLDENELPQVQEVRQLKTNILENLKSGEPIPQTADQVQIEIDSVDQMSEEELDKALEARGISVVDN